MKSNYRDNQLKIVYNESEAERQLEREKKERICATLITVCEVLLFIGLAILLWVMVEKQDFPKNYAIAIAVLLVVFFAIIGVAINVWLWTMPVNLKYYLFEKENDVLRYFIELDDDKADLMADVADREGNVETKRVCELPIVCNINEEDNVIDLVEGQYRIPYRHRIIEREN